MAGELGKLRHFLPFSRFDDEFPIVYFFVLFSRVEKLFHTFFSSFSLVKVFFKKFLTFCLFSCLLNEKILVKRFFSFHCTVFIFFLFVGYTINSIMRFSLFPQLLEISKKEKNKIINETLKNRKMFRLFADFHSKFPFPFSVKRENRRKLK